MVMYVAHACQLCLCHLYLVMLAKLVWRVMWRHRTMCCSLLQSDHFSLHTSPGSPSHMPWIFSQCTTITIIVNYLVHRILMPLDHAILASAFSGITLTFFFFETELRHVSSDQCTLIAWTGNNDRENYWWKWWNFRDLWYKSGKKVKC